MTGRNGRCRAMAPAPQPGGGQTDREEYHRTIRRTRQNAEEERLALVMETICATGIRVGGF